MDSADRVVDPPRERAASTLVDPRPASTAMFDARIAEMERDRRAEKERRLARAARQGAGSPPGFVRSEVERIDAEGPHHSGVSIFILLEQEGP